MRYRVYTINGSPNKLGVGSAEGLKSTEDLVAIFQGSATELSDTRQRAEDYTKYLNLLEEAKEETMKSITIATAVAARMTK